MTIETRTSAVRIDAGAGALKVTPNVTVALPDSGALPDSAPSSVSSLAPGDAHIWYRFSESLDDDVERAEGAQLAPDERVRCQRFVFRRDRRDFAASHALLRRVLSMYDDVRPEA